MSTDNGPASACPTCGSNRYTSFFELRGVPTQDGMLWPSHDEALAALRGDIRLACCASCGYIGNQLFDPSRIKYDGDYTFSMFFSPTFRTFLSGVATRLVTQYAVRDKAVIEVACGEGDFLTLLCQVGGNRGLGVDPTTTRESTVIDGRPVRFVREYYTNAYAAEPADLICCRQALDQLPSPKDMVSLIRENIGDRRETIVYVEVPNAESIFDDLLIRNIMYEKSSWFTACSLRLLFTLCGFEPLAVETCFDGGQYLSIDARPAVRDARLVSEAPSDAFLRSIETFDARYRRKVADWQERLGSLTGRGRRVMAWGSGAGAVKFFSALDVRDAVPYVVDINPRRQGRFMPLTGQEVVSPAFVREYRPDAVIVTNATFEAEIRQQLVELGCPCEVWAI